MDKINGVGGVGTGSYEFFKEEAEKHGYDVPPMDVEEAIDYLNKFEGDADEDPEAQKAIAIVERAQDEVKYWEEVIPTGDFKNTDRLAKEVAELRQILEKSSFGVDGEVTADRANYFKYNVESSNRYLYAGGDDIDLSDYKKGQQQTIDMLKGNAMYDEDAFFEKMHAQGRLENESNLWDINKVDGFTRTVSEYTYNWTYSGPDIHFDVYTDTTTGKVYACARVHVGADARVGFTDSYIMYEGEKGEENDLLVQMIENFTGNTVMLNIKFNDGSSITLDGQASDSYHFEFGSGGEEGIAKEFLNWLESQGNDDWDDVLDKVVDIY